jgi:selenocysteine lyase/cysteine desulfurase
MLERLQDELPSYGYLPLTRRDSSGPLVSFARQDATNLGPALQAAGIKIQLYPNRLRISPSVFNTMEEIEQLIAVLRSQ